VPHSVFGNFSDKGIVYRKEYGGELKILNLPAKNVLFNEYIRNINIEPVNSGKVIYFLKKIVTIRKRISFTKTVNYFRIKTNY